MVNGVPPQPAMEVRIWGARGSVPTPAAENLRIGGNTSCMEIRTPSAESFIFDAGTGIRLLGLARTKLENPPTDIHIFLTHFHWDHLQGLPFFTPLYSPKNTITFHSSCTEDRLREVLSGQMTNPYFPVKFDLVAAEMRFDQITDPEEYGSAKISTFPLHHPGGACGYIVECGGAKVVYATDHEHGTEADEGLVQAATNADLLIYDAQFTPEEYPTHIGWGHSTWLEATRIANDANVKQLVLFHHDPAHTDNMMLDIVEAARHHFPNTGLAVESSSILVFSREHEHATPAPRP